MDAFTIAAVLSVLAAWLGYRAGWRHGCAAVSMLLWHCGIRGLSSTDRTITFSDGTSRTERGP